jgi:hypothetical protein
LTLAPAAERVNWLCMSAEAPELPRQDGVARSLHPWAEDLTVMCLGELLMFMVSAGDMSCPD